MKTDQAAGRVAACSRHSAQIINGLQSRRRSKFSARCRYSSYWSASRGESSGGAIRGCSLAACRLRLALSRSISVLLSVWKEATAKARGRGLLISKTTTSSRRFGLRRARLNCFLKLDAPRSTATSLRPAETRTLLLSSEISAWELAGSSMRASFSSVSGSQFSVTSMSPGKICHFDPSSARQGDFRNVIGFSCMATARGFGTFPRRARLISSNFTRANSSGRLTGKISGLDRYCACSGEFVLV